MTEKFHIATGLAKIGLYLRAEGWQQAESESLTPTQGQILVHLVRRGPARITALAEELAVTQPTASDALSALIRKGHVEKRSDPADGRASLLHVTTQGRRVAEVMAEWPDALLSAIDTLETGEQAVFLRGLTRMIRELQVRGAIPVQRMCATCSFFRPNVHNDPAAPHHCASTAASMNRQANPRPLPCGRSFSGRHPEKWTPRPRQRARRPDV